jgi:hypothetical protein
MDQVRSEHSGICYISNCLNTSGTFTTASSKEIPNLVYLLQIGPETLQTDAGGQVVQYYMQPRVLTMCGKEGSWDNKDVPPTFFGKGRLIFPAKDNSKKVLATIRNVKLTFTCSGIDKSTQIVSHE